ncbi:hypothetical protein BDW62DRAFT_30736 [Aspergillus aurantiobrunneus]
MPPSRPLLFSSRSSLRAHLPTRYLARSSNLRHVRVKRPWFSRVVTRFLFFGSAAYVWSLLFQLRQGNTAHDVDSRNYSPERRTLGDSTADKSQHSILETQRQSRSRAIFIPIGWTRLQEGEFYAASDTEWKTFREISKDHKKIRALKDELVSIVLSEASQSSLLSRMLGPPFAVSRQWLQTNFPSRAPPAYYRSGLAITDVGISWGWTPVSNETLRKSVRPYFVALAVKDAYSVLWGSFVDKFKTRNTDVEQALSLPVSSTKTLLPSDFKALDKLGEASRPESPVSPSTTPQNGASRNDGDRHPHSLIILSTLQWLPLPKFGPGTDLYAASLAFKQRINECQVRELRAGRRGTFSVHGLVGLAGSLGFCRIEVEGEYDPGTSEWISVSMHLKDLNSFKQQALGGK